MLHELEKQYQNEIGPSRDMQGAYKHAFVKWLMEQYDAK